jgi:hypothetical protein
MRSRRHWNARRRDPAASRIAAAPRGAAHTKTCCPFEASAAAMAARTAATDEEWHCGSRLRRRPGSTDLWTTVARQQSRTSPGHSVTTADRARAVSRGCQAFDGSGEEVAARRSRRASRRRATSGPTGPRVDKRANGSLRTCAYVRAPRSAMWTSAIGTPRSRRVRSARQVGRAQGGLPPATRRSRAVALHFGANLVRAPT